MTPEQIANPTYRYTLRRTLTDAAKAGATVRTVVWVMLNPSTADDLVDDPTIRKVMHLSREHGYDELVVVNLFAARSTQPKHLLKMANPRGPENPAYIEAAIDRAEAVVFAFGSFTKFDKIPGGRDWGREVWRKALETHGQVLCCGINGDGSPKHPCYLPNDTKLVPW